ncbi:MAG: ATP-binding protein [Candidatus Methanomethyliaceae archaeon]
MNKITSIVARQRKEGEERLSSRKLVERDSEARLRDQLENNIIKVISGVRRSGKSTLALLLLRGKKFGYVNFDEKELTGVSLDELLSSLREVYGEFDFLLLDEIQNVNGWELWANSLQRRGYRLIITGSNAKLLSKELATHLTGRFLELENYPFSFREFLRFKKFNTDQLEYLKERQGEAKRLLREYLERGGFPEYLVEGLDESYLRTLFDSIVYNDIVKRWNVKNAVKVEDLARYIVSIFGREYSATKLRNALDLKSTVTVQNYVKYLEEAFIIFSLERFSLKMKEFMKAPKKVYCVDLGLSNAISTRMSEEFGLRMENAVFLELKRRGFKENRNMFYFRKNDKEVDFLLKEGLEVKELIQVTYASGRDEIEKRELKALIEVGELLNCKNMLLITWDYDEEETLEGRTIKFLPLWKWLIGATSAQ